MHLPPLPLSSNAAERSAQYARVGERLDALLEGETDWVAAQATVSCELHHAFECARSREELASRLPASDYHWTGFYRVVGKEQLVIGPYQGSHGCLRIAFSRGVCGAAAREARTQLVPDVHAFPGHIACAGSTQSEIVLPVFGGDGALLAVFDVDSDDAAAFTEVDQKELEALLAKVGAMPYATGLDK